MENATRQIGSHLVNHSDLTLAMTFFGKFSRSTLLSYHNSTDFVMKYSARELRELLKYVKFVTVHRVEYYFGAPITT